MKMTLKNRIDHALEVVGDNDLKSSMHSNDRVVVFYASAMLGSKLDQKYNYILMNRNAIPSRWKSDPRLSDWPINFAFKKGSAQVTKYIEKDYNITPGRVQKLADILSDGLSLKRLYISDDESLRRYLRNLNNLEMHCEEMTNLEKYDFSFDMLYDYMEKDGILSKITLSLSLLIMYWLQRKYGLIPIAMRCDKDKFNAALGIQSEETCNEREAKKSFRLFMRNLLDLHLKEFLRNYDVKKKIKSRDRILKLIEENPTHTAKTMASCLGLSVQAIQKQIAILKNEKRLKRIGPDKGGRWEVVKGKSGSTKPLFRSEKP